MTLNIDPLVYWITERKGIDRRRAAGEPQSSWTNDPLLANYRFTNINVQDDRGSGAIYETITLPYAEQPNLIVALAACRFSNEPEVFEVIADCFFPSFDPERYVARMAERRAQGLSLERRAYRIPAPKIEGELKAAYHTRELFIPLARRVEEIRPKPGDTVNAVFQRLRGFTFLGKGFLGAQIIRDLKQIAPLRDASDWRIRLVGTGFAAVHRLATRIFGRRGYQARESAQRLGRSR
jgi:5-hmdU DNA kinase-like protein